LETSTNAYRYRVGLVNLELGWLVFIAAHSGREQVEKGFQETKVFSCDVGHLEDGAYPRERERRMSKARDIYCCFIH